MTIVRIGLVGAGTIGQIEHLPNLLALPERFAVAGVADPSAAVRAFVTDRYGVAAHATTGALLEQPLDALLVATPDAFHPAVVTEALARGLHVLCEKPLAIDPADCERIVAAAANADGVVQVGYMKRFDPAVEAALDAVAGLDGLRAVSVEVNDPGAWPFVGQHPHRRADDVPAELVQQGRQAAATQAAAAVGRPLTGHLLAGYLDACCSSLVHEVNLVHGILDRLAVTPEGVISGVLFAGGAGVSASVRLLGGAAVWRMMHLTVPGLADYRERVTVYGDDALVELTFPSPWLNHQAARLRIVRTRGGRREETLPHPGFAEAYVRELEGFHEAITDRAPVRNPPEHALRDMRLLADIARTAAEPP